MSSIRRTTERLVYENDVVRVFDDDVAFPSGREGRHLRIEHVPEGEGVVLLVRDPHRRVALVETYRYPLGHAQLALPRGFSHGVDVEATARAEALEELGVRLARIRVLGHVTPDSGLLAARVAVLAAEVDGPVDGVPSDRDEVIAVHWLSLDELAVQVRDGRVEDGFTLAALALLLVSGTDASGQAG